MEQTDELAQAERALLAWLRTAAATAWSTECLVLDHGRWFTPAPWPPRMPRRGMPGNSYRNAHRVARLLGLVYVEGYAWHRSGTPVPHAWVSGPAGTALDPTWPAGDGLAYFGVPLTVAFVDAFRQRTRTKTGTVGVLDARTQATRDASRLFEGGIPATALVPVGRRW